MEFTLNIQPPTVTAQKHRVRVLRWRTMVSNIPKPEAQERIRKGICSGGSGRPEGPGQEKLITGRKAEVKRK